MLAVLFVVQVGVENGDGADGQYQGEGDPDDGFQGQKHAAQQQNAANDKNFAAKTMGGVPVFFVFQRPLDLDADGLVLLALGHVVAQQNEGDSHKQREDQDGRDGAVQRGGVGHSAHEQGEDGDEPKPEVHDLGALVLVFGIFSCDKHGKEMHRQEECGHEKHGDGLTAPAVRLTVGTPVGGHFFRKLLPNGKTEEDRQQNNDR